MSNDKQLLEQALGALDRVGIQKLLAQSGYDSANAQEKAAFISGIRHREAEVLDAPLPAAPEQEPVALPFAIFENEMAALRRFHECVMDGDGYDVKQELMERLSEIGLIRQVKGRIYEATTFGLSVLTDDFATPPAAPVQERTVTVRYDLSAADTEGAIRDKLIELGWTPPAQPAPVQEPVTQQAAAYVAICEVLEQLGFGVLSRAPSKNQIDETCDVLRTLYTTPPAAQPAVPLPQSEWPKHPSPYVNDEYRGYLKSDLDDYAMQVLAAHGITEKGGAA